MVLAAFVSPSLFVAGLGAVSIPVLIHLLARRRFQRIRWAAMEFLVHAERRNRRRIHMEEWILLALRCLALALIATVIARPFLEPRGLAASFGGSARTERVFVIDDSLSMGYQSNGETSFDRAKEAVRRIVGIIRREAPDDTVTILRMSAVDGPVEAGTYLDDTQTVELLERLEGLSLSQSAINPDIVIKGVADQLARDPGLVNCAIYIISDFQRHNWLDTNPRQSQENEGGIFAPLQEWATEGRGMHLVMVNVADGNAENTAVTELSVQTSQLVAGASGRVRIGLANHGDAPKESLRVDLSLGHVPQPSKVVNAVAARSTASVDVEIEFQRPGWEVLRAEIPPDSLPADNVRHLAVEVVRAIRILIINGEPSADSFDDETTFLATALRPEGEVFSGNEVTVINEAELDEVNLEESHVVVLANVHKLSESAVASLERYTRNGGGVVFFLGDQVDADIYNATFYRNGEGLLPTELTEIVSAGGGTQLEVVDRLHPVMRGVSREGDPLGLGQVRFFRYFGSVPIDSVTTSDNDDEAHSSSDAAVPARVIARFNDSNRGPAIIERRFGNGRTLLLTTSADKEWHHWPDHPTFLPVMMELVSYVARRSDSGKDQWVGEAIEIAIDPAQFDSDVAVRTPGYPAEPELVATALPASDGRGLVLSWDHANESGVYQFALRRRSGGESIRLIAVNVDPRESDLSTVSEDDLRASHKDVAFEYVEGIDNLSGEVAGSRMEFWRFFIFLAGAILMCEQFLAWRWGRRR